jgi:hypothetical protein
MDPLVLCRHVSGVGGTEQLGAWLCSRYPQALIEQSEDSLFFLVCDPFDSLIPRCLFLEQRKKKRKEDFTIRHPLKTENSYRHIRYSTAHVKAGNGILCPIAFEKSPIISCVV